MSTFEETLKQKIANTQRHLKLLDKVKDFLKDPEMLQITKQYLKTARDGKPLLNDGITNKSAKLIYNYLKEHGATHADVLAEKLLIKPAYVNQMINKYKSFFTRVDRGTYVVSDASLVKGA